MVFQDDDMEHILNTTRTCSQTDSIEGFIEDADLNDQINITFTSSYDDLLHRWVPLCIHILFGKSALHYKVHWNYVFHHSLLKAGISSKRISPETQVTCPMR